ncbi:glycosyltransferase [Candidatus Pacearchaeota archaeon]|nr:glycosyltransferase [Candidatus Pacearchaeota archaeon]
MTIKKSPKVLVAGPTFDGMEYCHEKFINRLKNLSYDNYDVLLVDNSESNEFFKKLKKESGIKAIRLQLENISNINRIVRSRNRILNYAIMNFYDYVLMMDVDVIPPVDVVERLLAHKKDIVSGIYYNVFMVDRKKKICPVAWKGFSDEEFEEIRSQVSSEFVTSPDHLRRHLSPEEANGGELQEVLIPSCGCMLLNRDVFKKIQYGVLDVPDGFSTTDDIYFCRKAREAGFKLYCDTGLQCEHLLNGKFQRNGDEWVHPLHR